MTLNELMIGLAQLNVKLSTRSGELLITAPKGAIDSTIKEQLKRYKSQIIELLNSDYSEVKATEELQPNIAQRYEPFPFSDLQVGFYMADDPYMEYHVRPHYYGETDFNELDVQRYENALNKTLDRHRGEIVLVFDDAHLRALEEVPPVKIKINDFRKLAGGDAEHKMMILREQLKRQELPLDRWPWFDVQISRWIANGQEKTRIHFNHNNFYSDGFGAMILQNEIERFYATPDLTLPPLKFTLRDSLVALQNLSFSAAGKRAQSYWLNRLADLPGPPKLPQRHGINRRKRSLLQRRENYLSANLWSQFKENCASRGLTPSSVIITAYAEILSIWSDSQHFILSNMVTRRLPLHAEIGEMIGNFASLYPLEIDLRGDDTFTRKAHNLQKQILQDSNHREWGGMQVMQAFNRLKGEFASVPCPFVVGSGLFLNKYKKSDFSCLETAQTIFDHQFWELEDNRYYYVWDLIEEFFPAGMIDQMWQAFGNLLNDLAHGEDIWERSHFTVLSAAPEQNITDSQNPEPINHGELVHVGLAKTMAHNPDKAVLLVSDHKMTYRSLDRFSAYVASNLSAHALGPNQLVALVLDKSALLLAATLGVLKAGAAYVPIDPTLPLDRIHYLLANSKTPVVITQAKYSDGISWPADIQVIVLVDEPPPLGEYQYAQRLCSPTDLAYVIYTSGSTGNPKGVMIDHRAVLNTIRDINKRFDIGAEDIVFGVSSFSFDLSVYDLFGVLDAGATLVYPGLDEAMNPAAWLSLMMTQRVTVWNSAPPLMSLLAEVALRQQVLLPNLRIVMLSGDWIPLELPGQIRQFAPDATIISLGGATEAAIWSIYYVIDDVDPEWLSIPYGKALANQGWRVMDAKGRQCPIWTTGELFITGLGLAQGYWGDPEKTRNSFIDASGGQRLYRTGDRGRLLPDGNIEFMGRVDTQVKIQGYRIELGEIEAALNEHALVKHAVVLARPLAGADSAKVKLSDAKQLVAYVVCQPLSSDESKEYTNNLVQTLREALALKLPNYMIPSGWALLEQMPLSKNGKLDRKQLDKIDYACLSKAELSVQVAPRNPIESALVLIWELILKQDNISIQDDFFDLGGQSFDAVRCLALIQEQFNRKLSLGDIWRYSTIEKLAIRISQGGESVADQRVIKISGDRGRPYFFVHPAGGQINGYFELADRLNRPSYGCIALLEDVEADDLGAIEDIAARYVSQLLNIQATGPYTLGGWSSGGCIAFEMVVQLEKMGHVVDQLFLFDCPSPVVHEPINETNMLRGFFEDLDLNLPLELIEAGEAQLSASETLFSDIVARLSDSRPALLDPSQLYPFYGVFRNVVNAVRNYHPQQKIKGAEMVVVRAGNGEVTEFANHPYTDLTDWGWTYLSEAPVKALSIPMSTHYTLLKLPFVENIAELMIKLSRNGENV